MAMRIALCGKGPRAADFAADMKPEYDITHVFNSVATAQQELPGILQGEAINPSSGLGSDAQDPKGEKVYAVIVGGGFTGDEVASMRQIDGADNIPWFHGNPAKVDRARFPEGMPPTSHMTERAKGVMKEQGVVSGSSQMSKGLFDF